MRTIKNGVKSVLRMALRMLGHDLVFLASPMRRCTMEGAMRAMHGRGHGIRTVVEVGASDGSWSGALMRHFPACQYLLVEAQPVHGRAQRAFRARNPNAQFMLAAAGDRMGRIHFDASDSLGGLASFEPSAANDIEVPVVSVDGELKARGLQGPYLLTLDTHASKCRSSRARRKR